MSREAASVVRHEQSWRPVSSTMSCLSIRPHTWARRASATLWARLTQVVAILVCSMTEAKLGNRMRKSSSSPDAPSARSPPRLNGGKGRRVRREQLVATSASLACQTRIAQLPYHKGQPGSHNCIHHREIPHPKHKPLTHATAHTGNTSATRPQATTTDHCFRAMQG